MNELAQLTIGDDRVSFLALLSDLHMVQDGVTEPLISTFEMNLDLPSTELLWSAETASDWRDAIIRTRPVALSFHHTLDALLAPTPPPWSSPAGRLLRRLPSQSPFVLAILTNTLLALQSRMGASQTFIEALATPSEDPLSTLAAAVRNEMEAVRERGVEGAETVRRGLAILGASGADASGKWFRGITRMFR